LIDLCQIESAALHTAMPCADGWIDSELRNFPHKSKRHKRRYWEICVWGKGKGAGVDLVYGMEFSKLISNIEKVDTVDCHIMHNFCDLFHPTSFYIVVYFYFKITQRRDQHKLNF
jgi:hypothetical protein